MHPALRTVRTLDLTPTPPAPCGRGVEPPDFENIRLLVVLRSITRALPILLVPLLVPRGSPSDADTPDSDELQSDHHGWAEGRGVEIAPAVPPPDRDPMTVKPTQTTAPG